MSKLSKIFLITISLVVGTGVGAVEKPKKAAPKKISIREQSRRGSLKSAGGGADRVEGYIIKRDGKNIIKIPKKQVFEFGGSEVEGSTQAPSQSVFGKRPNARPATLIPERQSFRSEFFESAGVGER